MPQKRSEKSHQAILKAAIELVKDEGYAGTTIEGIASRAGVGKQTIYRWWPSKAAVIMEAFQHSAAEKVPVPDTGDTRADLQLFARKLCCVLSKPVTCHTTAGLIAAAQEDQMLAKEFRKMFIKTRRSAVEGILQRGVARGELLGEADFSLTLDLFFGPIWYRVLMGHAPLEDKFADALVAAVMSTIAAPSVSTAMA
ncbi:MAG: TetR/AcrR family transcriptional regulator [Anaerolineales bacterium]|nr:TetR/AcrR family transcriptional regulator [Anaerolineales bacterium]